MTYVRIVLILGCMLMAALTLTAGERPCDRGAFIVDGNVLLTHAGGKELYGPDGVTIGTVQAAVGQFVADHFMLGLGVSLYTNSRDYVEDQWSLGPIVGVYFDPAAESNRVKGAFLPFARAFFFVGNAGDYNGDTHYSFGGDLGVTAMLNRTVGLEMLFRLSQDRVTNIPVRNSPFDGDYYHKTQSGTTILVGLGLMAFL